MSLKIISQKENAFFRRKDIEAEVDFDKATPSRNDIKTLICAKVGCAPELLSVALIDTNFGEHKAKVTARAYENADDFKRLETTSKRKKAVAAADGEAKK